MLSSQETCPHCGLVSATDSPYANRSGQAAQYSGNAGPKNIASIAWALPLGCLGLFLMFIGGKWTYLAMMKSGTLGAKSNGLVGIAAYDSLMWYFQLPIASVILVAAIGIIVTSWKAVFE